jgi:hypothetical protein
MPTTRPPFGLTDEQVHCIMEYAAPLEQRSDFLAAVIQELSSFADVGDGSIGRVCRELQRQFFDPPNLSGANDASKYR